MSNFQLPIILPPLESLQWLQGSPISDDDFTHDIQLLLLVQSNCPGCHSQAIPLANKLVESKQDFDVYCIFTAFEDFEYNTKESARQLVLEGKHVGVTKQRLGETAKDTPKMPVAFDNVIRKQDATQDLLNMAFESTKYITYEQSKQMSPEANITLGMIERQLEKMGGVVDVLPEYIAEVFYKVRAQGTPTWVIHKNPSREVLDVKFGQQKQESLLEWINSYL